MVKSKFRGSSESLYDTAYDLGINYLKLVKNKVKNPMVMFDIDDTLLFINRDESLSPITPMINLLNYCLKNGIAVLILTARDSRYLAETKNDLAKNGINYNYIYLRKSPQDNHQYFKSDVKKMYTQSGFTVIMSVGDNEVDIIGDYSGYSIKLPNKTDPRLFHVNMENKLENVIP
jgi:predicted secreted acid phosphatase